MNLIKRSADIVTGNQDLEHLFTFKNFPVFMGCTTDDASSDIKSDMSWYISPSSGMIQLNPLIPMDVIYNEGHGAGSVGGLWGQHHKALAEFVYSFSPNNVIEIGGGHGELSRCYHEHGNAKWTIVEPNPSPADGVNAEYIKEFFDENFVFTDEFDTVVHSHVFEHIFDIDLFMQHIADFMPVGKKLIFSLPNMEVMLKRGYTNCINFEHTILLTETYVEYFLSKFGFGLLAKQYFKDDHSIFYAAERIKDSIDLELPAGLYEKYKSMFKEYIKYHHDLITDLNSKIHRPVYLFGAHVFSQYLIEFGLEQEKIICLLDNDPNKQGKRLYGTDLIVSSPKILKDVENPIVILRAGVYNDEIQKDILENINPNTTFLN